MDCNKDEAIRAKNIAERKMQNGDFEGAKKIALKALQLYPDLDNISQMLAVCEVHCSAQNKLYGSEMDWYGILQVERFSDEAVIKKQYRKFALSLHPDKNKFSGAEAAFKLIGEANRVLTDPAKRSLFDMKCRGSVRPAAPKPTSHQSNQNSIAKKQHEANKFSSAPSSQYMSAHPYQPQRPTFWTCCTSCNMRYQYYRELQNKTLRCQSCQNSFVAINLDIHGVLNGSPWSQFRNQNGVPNQGPSKVVPPRNSGKPSGASFSDRFRPVNIGGSSKPSEVKAGNNTKNGSASKELGTSKGASRKRGKQSRVESSESFETGSGDDSDEDVVQENSSISGQNSGSCGGNQRRRSSRQKQNVSYKENLINDDDFVVSQSKRQRVNGLSSVIEEEIKEAVRDGRVHKEHTSAGVDAAAVNRNKKGGKQMSSSSLEESLSNKKSKTDVLTKREEASMVEKADARSDNKDGKPKVDGEPNVFSNEAVIPETLEIPDPDFSNFENDKAENCFAVNQMWAIYDDTDGMPRFYARIKKVLSPGFKLLITWLEASSDLRHEKDWSDKDLPVACGKFESGDSQRTADRALFSHQMCFMNGNSRGSYYIYPQKGETWALFKDWEMKWSSEPEKHRPPYRFEFVEVLSDFDENFGIGVAYLQKVKGFVSIFQRAARDRVIQFCIPPTELYKFSHRIPSFRMSGKEGVGVPAGSFELDPASLPSNLDDLSDPSDTKLEKGNVHNQSTNLCSQTPKSELKTTKGSKKICMPDKYESRPEIGSSIVGKSPTDTIVIVAGLRARNWNGRKVIGPGNIAQPGGINISSSAKVRIETPEKQYKSELAADALATRRSPRDLSKRNGEVNASQGMTEGDTQKNTAANNDVSLGKPSSLLSQPDDTMYAKGGGSVGLIISAVSSGRKVVELEVECYNFEREKSQDKFHLDQIWALYSNDGGLPKNYCQIKVIDSTPNFRLHVAMLEACTPPRDARQPVCCGIFKVNDDETRVLSTSKFSHLLKVQSIGNSKYEIHPRKGEIWALYKNGNSEFTCSDQSVGESDIVEVLEDNECSVKVVVLIPARVSESPGRNKYFYWAPRIQRSKTGVLDIPRTEFCRFSHQCSAFKHAGEKEGRTHELMDSRDNLHILVQKQVPSTENNNTETENPIEASTELQSETNNNGDGNHADALTKGQSSRKRTPKSLMAKSKAIEKPSANNSLKSKKAKSSPKFQGRNRKKYKDIIQGKGESSRNEHGDAINLNLSEKNVYKKEGIGKGQEIQKNQESAKTKPDCFLYRVMGVTMNKKELILGVKPGLKLFLYDFDLKLMYGIYEASSAGGVNLEPKAFGGSFPCQVRFAVHKDCFPITESVFKKAIKENYEKNKFKTELTVRQVLKLSALFHPVIGPLRSPPMVTVRDRAVYAGARDLQVYSDREAFARSNHDVRRYSMLSDEKDRHVEYQQVGSTHRDEFPCDLFMSEKEYRTYGLSGERRNLTPSHHIPSTLDPYQRDQEREHLPRQPDPIYRDTVPLQREAVWPGPLYLNRPYYSSGRRESPPAITSRPVTASGSALAGLGPYTMDPYYTYRYGASSSDAYVPPPLRDELSSGSYYADGRRETYLFEADPLRRREADQVGRLYSTHASDALSNYNKLLQYDGARPETAPPSVSSRYSFAGPSASYR
ncbi:hypothetical protein DKX38_007213 [Salix brachista]|uniref:J domain-containing protein n=1 Tax=Salix brachista TaxID=2182728 RepID=A0A5N5MMK1_9ROSI|nr:hypothetical protein DKX38_007213 [Salix brachista]